MNANPILLQKKYARVIQLLAEKLNITMGEALDFFYHSKVYDLVSNGISDMHCMSDEYLEEELEIEYRKQHTSDEGNR